MKLPSIPDASWEAQLSTSWGLLGESARDRGEGLTAVSVQILADYIPTSSWA